MPERTHCLRGHEFTPENTRYRIHHDGRVQRRCRACAALTEKARRPRDHNTGRSKTKKIPYVGAERR